MNTVKTYRLGADDYVLYVLPNRREYADRLEATMGTVYSLIERAEIKGCIPEPWPRLAAPKR
jgi:hypothetical protein